VSAGAPGPAVPSRPERCRCRSPQRVLVAPWSSVTCAVMVVGHGGGPGSASLHALHMPRIAHCSTSTSTTRKHRCEEINNPGGHIPRSRRLPRRNRIHSNQPGHGQPHVNSNVRSQPPCDDSRYRGNPGRTTLSLYASHAGNDVNTCDAGEEGPCSRQYIGSGWGPRRCRLRRSQDRGPGAIYVDRAQTCRLSPPSSSRIPTRHRLVVFPRAPGDRGPEYLKVPLTTGSK